MFVGLEVDAKGTGLAADPASPAAEDVPDAAALADTRAPKIIKRFRYPSAKA